MTSSAVRWWMKLRMPHFGPDRTGPLVQEAIAASGVGDAPGNQNPNAQQITAGRKLISMQTGGLGCMACHGFQEYKPPAQDAARAPDMTLMATRLRPDFFNRWLRDPPRIQPGTAMPNFFVGKSEQETASTIDTLWHYFSLENGMPPPPGLVDKNNYSLAVDNDAITTRIKMANAAGGDLPRGIAVGLPGMISYCWDAGSCQFKYTWFGGYIDMKDQWTGRGGGAAKVQGRRFYAAPPIAPLRIGDLTHEPEVAFKGYRLLENKIPQFMYELDGVAVTETAVAAKDGIGLVRTFTIDAGDKPVFFITAEDNTVTITPSVGQFKKTESPANPGPAKTSGLILELPKNAHSFSITIAAKETK